MAPGAVAAACGKLPMAVVFVAAAAGRVPEAVVFVKAGKLGAQSVLMSLYAAASGGRRWNLEAVLA